MWVAAAVHNDKNNRRESQKWHLFKNKTKQKKPQNIFFHTQTQNVMIEESQMLEWLAEL